MNLHVAVGGWLLSQEPSGANRRLMAILRALPPLLSQGEQITVLHREGCLPPDPVKRFAPPVVDARAAIASRTNGVSRRPMAMLSTSWQTLVPKTVA